MIDTEPGAPRRLRFALSIRDDKSIPGAIARGVAGHHLVKVGVVLKEACAGRRAGLTQLAGAAILDRLAQIVRCDAHRLIAQAGRRLLDPGDRRLQHFVDFDGLVLPRGHLELTRRRISPRALLVSDHHRQAWLIAILPYCPQTLERLVDTCPLCGFTLGWVETAGIGRCENCLEVIPPNGDALPCELAENYRSFARLLSFLPIERASAVSCLPPRLRELTPGEVVRLAMRCGLDCDDGAGKRVWQTRAASLPAARLAETAVRGFEILRSWPEGIAAWAEDALDRALDKGRCARDLRRRIRRIAWGDSGFANQKALLGEVFENLEPPPIRNARDSERVYTGREAARRISGFSTPAAEIRAMGAAPHRRASDGDLGAYFYSASIIDAAANKKADAVSIASIIEDFQLPLYAIEQLFETSDLVRLEDPILNIIQKRPLASAAAYSDFVGRLRSRRSSRRRPDDALPPAHESRRIGGEAKPWSDIMSALIVGEIRFWSDGGTSVEQIMVRRGSLDDLIGTQARRVPSASPVMATLDAAELLNLIPGDVRNLRISKLLPHGGGMRGIRAIAAPRADVEKVAAHYVSATEMSRRARTTAEHVNQLRSLGFARFRGFGIEPKVLYALPLR